MTQIPNNAQFRADTTGVPIVEKGSNSTKSRSQFYTMQDIADSVASVVGVSFGISGQIPYTNAGENDFSYSDNFTWDASNNRLGIGTLSPLQPFHLNGNMLLGQLAEIRGLDSGSIQRTILYIDSDNNYNIGKSGGGALRFISGS